jgi:anthranilate phosphoribosyltransferase
LSALGIEICRTPEQALEQFRQRGITFVHSPYFNDFVKVNNPIRQQLGFKSVFNYLGPLINPAFPNAQLLGVSSNEMLEPCAYALQKLGTDRALVVNGLDPNLDEISVCSKTRVLELKNNEISEYFLSPEDFGIPAAHVSELKGGSAADNVRILNNMSNALKHVISLNAGAMIYLAGLSPSIFEGFQTAREMLRIKGFASAMAMNSLT